MATINQRNPTPLTRDVLRGLKQQVDEEKKQRSIDDTVGMLYAAAVHIAKTTTDTSFSSVLPSYAESPYKLYGEEILRRLKELFPDCTVSYDFIVYDMKGKRHLLSKVNSQIEPFLIRDGKKLKKDEAIIIDWS